MLHVKIIIVNVNVKLLNENCYHLIVNVIILRDANYYQNTLGSQVITSLFIFISVGIKINSIAKYYG